MILKHLFLYTCVIIIKYLNSSLWTHSKSQDLNWIYLTQHEDAWILFLTKRRMFVWYFNVKLWTRIIDTSCPQCHDMNIEHPFMHITILVYFYNSYLFVLEKTFKHTYIFVATVWVPMFVPRALILNKLKFILLAYYFRRL